MDSFTGGIKLIFLAGFMHELSQLQKGFKTNSQNYQLNVNNDKGGESVKKFLLIFAIVLLIFAASDIFPVYGDKIETQEQGEECFRIARDHLKKMGIVIDRKILLFMRPWEEVQVHFVSGGGLAKTVGGFYQPRDPESIWIIVGRSKNMTISDMSHELAHAWQVTNTPIQDRMLVEGFATWCQYKVMKTLGYAGFAEDIFKLGDPDYSEGLRLFMELERKRGVKGVVEYAKTATKPPKKNSKGEYFK
jgi:hypothetical protein